MSDIERLEKLVASNAQSIQAMSEFTSAGFKNTLEALNEQNQLITELREAQVETSNQIQNLIEESRFSRLNAERDRATFTEALQSLLAQIVGRLNDIWGKLAS